MTIGTATLQVVIDGTVVSALDLTTGSAPHNIKKTYTLTNGTGANMANNIFSDTRTLTASATEDLDLAGGLTNALGATLTFTKIKGIYIAAASGNTNDVVVGGASSNGFISWVGSATHTVKVKPGGCLFLAAPDANGYAVTAGTGDLLTITNSAGSTSVTYDILIIGVA